MKFFGPVLFLVLRAPLSGAIAASQKAVTVDIPAGAYAGQSSGPAIIMNASWVYGDSYPDYPWGDYSWESTH